MAFVLKILRDGWENCEEKTCLNLLLGHIRVSFSSEICKADKIGGSQRIFGTAWNQQQTNPRKSCDGAFSMSKNKSEFGSRRSVSANYKPIHGPNCSQCGKPFKPEKLHAHMKSCKGMKALSKG
ncbi:hypothetical protein KY284_002060 [Solanum tuberosum]|nr:hypothetical protein KY284_002060 [Solanum tuberosum]